MSITGASKPNTEVRGPWTPANVNIFPESSFFRERRAICEEPRSIVKAWRALEQQNEDGYIGMCISIPPGRIQYTL